MVSTGFWVMLMSVPAIGAVVFLLLQSAPKSPGLVEVLKLMAAAKAYAQQLKASGTAGPPQVSWSG